MTCRHRNFLAICAMIPPPKYRVPSGQNIAARFNLAPGQGLYANATPASVVDQRLQHLAQVIDEHVIDLFQQFAVSV